MSGMLCCLQVAVMGQAARMMISLSSVQGRARSHLPRTNCRTTDGMSFP